jgi:ABC-type uncharacterized transport system substrate-binding protein
VRDPCGADGRPERAHEIAADFVRRKADVIVTSGTPIVAVVKQVTSTIPIVFAVAGDPVGNGLVASLARAGGNISGLSLLQIEIAGKRLELLHEVVPGLRRLGIMGNFSNPPLALELSEVQKMANRLGLEVVTCEIRRPEDIAPAFDTLKAHAEALYVEADTLVVANGTDPAVTDLTRVMRLPGTLHLKNPVKPRLVKIHRANGAWQLSELICPDIPRNQFSALGA